MKQRPVTTLVLILIAGAVTLAAPVFDSSVYGINGHPTEWLSFLPSAPLRSRGLTLLLSEFIHIGPQHLLMNIVFFIPIGMMIERKTSAKDLLRIFFSLHFSVLLALAALNFILPLSGKAFLGMSHIVIGLYVFWALKNKARGLLLFSLLLMGAGVWEDKNLFSLLAHGTGAVMGVLLFALNHFWKKLRP